MCWFFFNYYYFFLSLLNSSDKLLYLRYKGTKSDKISKSFIDIIYRNNIVKVKVSSIPVDFNRCVLSWIKYHIVNILYFSKTSAAFQKALRDVCFHVSTDNRLINEVTIHQADFKIMFVISFVMRYRCFELPMKLMFVKNSLVMGYQCVKLSIILSSTVW